MFYFYLTCLHFAIIFSLTSSHLYHQAKHDFAKFGISTGEVSLDLDKMMENKKSIVGGLTGGIEFLFKK